MEKKVAIELTKEETDFIGYFLEEYYNGDFVGGECEKYDGLANSISDKIKRAWRD